MELVARLDHFKRLMRHRDFSGRRLAREAETSKSTIARLVSGTQTVVRGDLGIRIERALGVQPGSLFVDPETLLCAEGVEESPEASVGPAVPHDSEKSERQEAAA